MPNWESYFSYYEQQIPQPGGSSDAGITKYKTYADMLTAAAVEAAAEVEAGLVSYWPGRAAAAGEPLPASPSPRLRA